MRITNRDYATMFALRQLGFKYIAKDLNGDACAFVVHPIWGGESWLCAVSTKTSTIYRPYVKIDSSLFKGISPTGIYKI